MLRPIDSAPVQPGGGGSDVQKTAQDRFDDATQTTGVVSQSKPAQPKIETKNDVLKHIGDSNPVNRMAAVQKAYFAFGNWNVREEVDSNLDFIEEMTKFAKNSGNSRVSKEAKDCLQKMVSEQYNGYNVHIFSNLEYHKGRSASPFQGDTGLYDRLIKLRDEIRGLK